jgi:hypothetical protein
MRARFDILLFVLNEGTVVPAQHAKRRRGGHYLFNSLYVTEEITVLTPRRSLCSSPIRVLRFRRPASPPDT